MLPFFRKIVKSVRSDFAGTERSSTRVSFSPTNSCRPFAHDGDGVGGAGNLESGAKTGGSSGAAHAEMVRAKRSRCFIGAQSNTRKRIAQVLFVATEAVPRPGTRTASLRLSSLRPTRRRGRLGAYLASPSGVEVTLPAFLHSYERARGNGFGRVYGEEQERAEGEELQDHA